MTEVFLDEQSLDGETWYPLGAIDGVRWEYAHVSVESGSHTVVAEPEDVGIGIVSTGYSDWVSYGYPRGSGLAPISEAPPPSG